MTHPKDQRDPMERDTGRPYPAPRRIRTDDTHPKDQRDPMERDTGRPYLPPSKRLT